MGISVDSVFSHQAFANELGGLSYPLLADFHPKGAVLKAYGLWREDRGYARRSVVVVDASGQVQFVETYPTGIPDVKKVLAVVAGLQ